MNKIYYTLLLLSFSLMSFGQDMKINWSDRDGREFSITCISGEFSYSMIAGDRIEYEPSYSDNAGDVRKVGSVSIEYEPSYSDNAGKIRKVGGLTVEYEPSYSDNAGKIRSTHGSVN